VLLMYWRRSCGGEIERRSMEKVSAGKVEGRFVRRLKDGEQDVERQSKPAQLYWDKNHEDPYYTFDTKNVTFHGNKAFAELVTGDGRQCSFDAMHGRDAWTKKKPVRKKKKKPVASVDEEDDEAGDEEEEDEEEECEEQVSITEELVAARIWRAATWYWRTARSSISAKT